MSFNIRNSYGRDGRNIWWLRRRATVEVIRAAVPDVVGLQEVRPTQLRYLRRELSEFGMTGTGREGPGRGEHCPVMFRLDRFALAHHETRWLSDTPVVAASRHWGNQSPRIATIVSLDDRKTGERVNLVNTHLDEASVASRHRSAQALATWTGGQSIVVGDLNATIDDEELQPLQTIGLRDALDGYAAHGPGASTGHSFTGSVDGRRIDHILVPPEWRIVEAHIVHDRPFDRLPSDHWPIVAMVER